jgi:hypothetical protein
MAFYHKASGNETRLRVVFANDAVSVDLVADATFGDLAECVQSVANMHRGAPLNIAVTIPAASTPGVTSKGLSHGAS